MTRKIKIKTFDGKIGQYVSKEIEAAYIAPERVRLHLADIGIIYSCPDYWTFGEDLIVYRNRSTGEYLYTIRPSFDERRPRNG